ncbi:MAG: DUF342 domain-containing protein [Ignavibacteriales bacterium]
MSELLQEPVDGQVQVFISTNEMEASITVYGPKDGGNPVTLEQALEILKLTSVIEGIHNDRVAESIMEHNWGRRFVVAEGEYAVDGEDAHLEYKIELPDQQAKPIEMEDGRVDYKNIDLFVNVSRGQLLVAKTPARLGSAGITVTGKPALPKIGKNILLPRGKNTVADESQIYLYAACDGHVSVSDGKLVVNPVLDISGDVDFSVGNIDFSGNVFVRGNITSGFIVKAGGDIEVRGIIEGANVWAGGNIIVKSGIAGNHKGMVHADNNVYARFIENAKVEAGNSVLINDAIVQSNVTAVKAVKVEGKKGTIVGGIVQAGDEVVAKYIGSNLSPHTIVEVGVNPMLREENKTISQAYLAKKKVFDQVSQYLQTFQKSAVSLDNLPDRKKAEIVKSLQDFRVLKEEMVQLTARKQEIEEEMQRMRKGHVKAVEVVYPGVQITIGQAVYTVNDPFKSAMFVLEDGEVKVGSAY